MLLLSKYKFNAFAYNSLYLYISQFADYILAIFFIPFIAKTLGTLEFGKIGVIQTYGFLIIIFIEFGSSLFATREISRIKSSVEKLKFFIGIITTFKLILIPIVILFTFILSNFIPIFTNNLNYVIIVVIGSIFQGIAPIWFFLGIQDMKKIALSKLFFRFVGFLLIIFFIKSANDGWIVLASYSLASGLICIYLYIEMIKKTGLYNLAKPNSSFKLFQKSINSFLITVFPLAYQNVCVIILTMIVSPVQLGFYYGASRIYRVFNALFGPASQAFLPIVSEISESNSIKRNLFFLRYLFIITVTGFLLFFLCYYFSSKIILTFFGDQYFQSIEILKLFSFILPLTAISNALGRQWLIVINNDLNYALIQLLSFTIGIGVFLFFIKDKGIKSFPLSLIAYETISILLSLLIILKNEKN